MLDYLRLKIAEDTALALELLIQILYSYDTVARHRANTVQRKTAFLCVVGIL